MFCFCIKLKSKKKEKKKKNENHLAPLQHKIVKKKHQKIKFSNRFLSMLHIFNVPPKLERT